MKRKEWLLLILVVVVLGAAAAGMMWYRAAHAPQNTPAAAQKTEPELPPGTPSATLVITRDYGGEQLMKRAVPISQGDTVMDVLKREGGDVKTTYNGSFVESINGLASAYKAGDSKSKPIDWFFYVNGVMSDIGAGEYPVRTGDVITWDYHRWAFDTSAPALIGVYPQPFVQHDEETNKAIALAVMYAPGLQEQADQLAKALSTARQTETKAVAWNEQLFAEGQPLIVLGDSKAYADSAFYQKLWEQKAMYGLFAHFTKNGIEATDISGNVVITDVKPDAGAIVATVHPETRKPLWFVGGNSSDAIARIVHTIASGQTADTPWTNSFGLLQDGQETLRLPLGGTP
ncbi:DUF4430 domain-containing protein [Brevibacillus fluminis]|uniref:DUF4430 domain-containing protein n=1 Tax=Brevibacillus fluminis TaxID=511487 RepID=A0A3M8CSK5_9BACL|nr:DUF4430 domain-containing protein [Brevibacillus fluminis]RNB78760.1 DUF4430 domain-containing protein [Brevibacillus fluminis]